LMADSGGPRGSIGTSEKEKGVPAGGGGGGGSLGNYEGMRSVVCSRGASEKKKVQCDEEVTGKPLHSRRPWKELEKGIDYPKGGITTASSKAFSSDGGKPDNLSFLWKRWRGTQKGVQGVAKKNSLQNRGKTPNLKST